VAAGQQIYLYVQAGGRVDSAFGGGYVDFKIKPGEGAYGATPQADEGRYTEETWPPNGRSPQTVGSGAGKISVLTGAVPFTFTRLGPQRLCAWLTEDDGRSPARVVAGASTLLQAGAGSASTAVKAKLRQVALQFALALGEHHPTGIEAVHGPYSEVEFDTLPRNLANLGPIVHL
jgi:hypothetical protein